MTDITELAQSLKAAAEKATKGPWITFDDDFSDGEDAVVTNEARDDDCMSPVVVIKGGGSESDDDSPYYAEQRANAEFIALANPANILTLVEALEELRAQIDRQEDFIREQDQLIADLKRNWQVSMQRVYELEESHAQVIHSRDHYKALWRESLKESRTVTVKLPEVRITVAESRRRNMTWRELGAYNEGADVAAERIGKALTAAGISLEVE